METHEISEYTFDCVSCLETFTADNPCCCDNGCIKNQSFETYDKHGHIDGLCVKCCKHPSISPIYAQNYRGE